MGRPKALLPWRARTLVETVVATLRGVVEDVVVVSSDAFELPALDARIVRDREPGLGPLAGIREGLHALGSGLAFVASTDTPYLSTRFVEALLSFGSAAATARVIRTSVDINAAPVSTSSSRTSGMCRLGMTSVCPGFA